jgi:hypothetical protein
VEVEVVLLVLVIMMLAGPAGPYAAHCYGKGSLAPT